MSYNKEVFLSAKEKLIERRNDALRIADYRKNEVYSKDNRFDEIDRELASIGVKSAKAILRGANAKDELNELKNASTALQVEYKELLEKYGYSSDYLNPVYVCPKCEDTGYIELDNKTVMCECFKKLITEESTNKLNSISPLSLSTFDTFTMDYYDNLEIDGKSVLDHMSKVYNYCVEYADTFNVNSTNVFMYGATGLGKTHLSLAIANEVIKKGYTVIYVSAPDILSKLEKEHFGYNYEVESDTFKELMNADLLIIDDLGTEFSSQFTKSAMYNIFNTRILRNKPIILNTNLKLAEIEKYYSQRFSSRVIGSCRLINFIGKDVRTQL